MAQDIQKSGPQPINIWLESLRSSQTNAPSEPEGKREAILLLLGKLALHYWRPDFTPGQARQIYADYADDLMPHTLERIDCAIRAYRQSGEKFYPTSGQLVQLIATPPAWWCSGRVEYAKELAQETRAETQAMLQIGSSPPKQIAAE